MARKSKAEWIAFFAKHEASGKTLSEFCAARKVPYQSAKNWSSQLKKAGEYPVSGAGTGTEKSGTDAANGTGTGTGRAKTGRIVDRSKNGGKKPKNPSSVNVSSPNPGKPRDTQGWLNKLANLKPYEAGERRPEAVTHGAYTKFLPPDVQAELNTYGRNELREVIEEIRLTKGRLLIVSRNKAAWDASNECGLLTDDDYLLEEIETGKGGLQGNTRKEKRKRPDFEHHEDRLTRRLAWLMQVQDQLSKKASFTADEAIAMRREIIERGEASGWTYAQIGMEIEKYGIELPFTLQALIRHELDQPQIEADSGGLTDDELEQLSAEYERSVKDDDEWLKSRQAEVQEIHDVRDAARTAT